LILDAQYQAASIQDRVANIL